MNKKTIITTLFVLVAVVGQAQTIPTDWFKTDTITIRGRIEGYDAELAKKITGKHHFTWTHLVEAKDMMSWIGTEGFPFTVVVDKQGIVRHAVHGTSEDKRAELLAKIKEVDAE